MSAITLTDKMNPDRTTGLINTDEIIEQLTPWFPGADADVTADIAALQEFMEAGNWFAANEYVLRLGLEARAPSVVDLLVFISDESSRVSAAAEDLAAATSARNDLIRTAFRNNVGGPLIAQAAGITVARAYQIRDGR
ncbi:hypothetical protein IC607_02565 [Cellulomonas sp. JH27-2]|uniref:hypothetical protein n=1 Tax=Cellulomonas sp. JH27-2 TaxID=2774139 RepID=UPI001780B0C4|nr:hypothetical protein [Cellulomonas sp. JH27-2]MBD8057848.1 hypothetical protein [Cellulomonas sp. JH27-2]